MECALLLELSSHPGPDPLLLPSRAWHFSVAPTTSASKYAAQSSCSSPVIVTTVRDLLTPPLGQSITIVIQINTIHLDVDLDMYIYIIYIYLYIINERAGSNAMSS